MTASEAHIFRGQPKGASNQTLEGSDLSELAFESFSSAQPDVKPREPIALTAALHQAHSVPSAIYRGHVTGQQQYIAHPSASIPLHGLISGPPPWTGNQGGVMTTVVSPSLVIGTFCEQKDTRQSKRRRADDDSDAEWDGGDDEKNAGNEELRQAGLCWACPFYKLDSWTHYRCLEKYDFRRVADVKQHILRCHTLPRYYYCTRCWLQWKSSKQWKLHILENTCTEVAGPESLNQDEVMNLDELPRGRTNAQKWYSLWYAFFKGHTPPSSPYVQSGIDEPVSLLRSHAIPLLIDMLPLLLRNADIQADGNAVRRLRSGIENIVFESPRPPKRFRLYPDTITDATATEPGSHDVNKACSSTVDVLPTVARSCQGETLTGLAQQFDEVQRFPRVSASSQPNQLNSQLMNSRQTNQSCAPAISPAKLSETTTPPMDPSLEYVYEPTYSFSELDVTTMQSEGVSQADNWGGVATE